MPLGEVMSVLKRVDKMQKFSVLLKEVHDDLSLPEVAASEEELSNMQLLRDSVDKQIEQAQHEARAVDIEKEIQTAEAVLVRRNVHTARFAAFYESPLCSTLRNSSCERTEALRAQLDTLHSLKKSRADKGPSPPSADGESSRVASAPQRECAEDPHRKVRRKGVDAVAADGNSVVEIKVAPDSA